ncbi:MAG: vWA domain-containing protein [Bdellovibrionales bacterium]
MFFLNTWLSRGSYLPYRILGAMLISLSLVFFQNCGQSGSVQLASGTILDEGGNAIVPGYSEKSLSTSDAPPLKLVFLVDNSNSMALNNLNLQQSLTSMFDSQANTLSQFNADIYVFTTAQLSGLGQSFAAKVRTPESLSTMPLSEIQTVHRGSTGFTGIIAGDLLGYSLNREQTPLRDRTEYRAQPVVAFRESGGVRSILPSIKYQRGSSIEDLKAAVKERLDTISPARAALLTDPSAFQVLDTESAMCGLARILRSPDSIIRPGDISSFIIVSDENEADLEGRQCLFARQREFLYRATCARQVPAISTSDTQVLYETVAGANEVRTTFVVTPKDQVRNRVITALSLTRAARNATCAGTQEREFNVSFQFAQSNYAIRYSRRPLVGTREGNVPIYGTEQTGLVTSAQAGVVPSDCMTNLSRLRSILNDNSSQFTIQSCMQNTDTLQSQSTTASFATYPAVNLAASTMCPSTLVTALSMNGTRRVTTCTMSRRTEAISSAALTAAGFPAQGTESDCRTAITQVCNGSNTQLRGCMFSSYGSPAPALSTGPIERTENSALNCDANCSLFSGLCAAGTTGTVRNYATSIGAACSASTRQSNETFVQTFSSSTVQVAGAAALTCASTCQDAPQACSGNRNTQTVADFNKTCTASSQVITGAPSQARSLPPVEDPNRVITCETPCASSNGICTGSRTIAQHVTQVLNGQNCRVQNTSRSVPETIQRQNITRLKGSQLTSAYCPAGFQPEGMPTLTAEFEDTTELASGNQNLPNYIVSQLQSSIGRQAATLTAFITPAGATNAGLSTSYGQAYENLVKSWGSGQVHDIRISSYAPALTQLGATLRSQLIRSVVFPEVTGSRKVRLVWHRPANQADWTPLSPEQWSATGGTVTLAPTVTLDLGDQIRIQHY